MSDLRTRAGDPRDRAAGRTGEPKAPEHNAARFPRISRRVLLSTAAALPALSVLIAATAAKAQTAAVILPSWHDGPAQHSIIDLVREHVLALPDLAKFAIVVAVVVWVPRLAAYLRLPATVGSGCCCSGLLWGRTCSAFSASTGRLLSFSPSSANSC